tara:strand:- start:982 stop:1371 length:390 start_codon:yes stop_codon:yes gene_type:complete
MCLKKVLDTPEVRYILGSQATNNQQTKEGNMENETLTLDQMFAEVEAANLKQYRQKLAPEFTQGGHWLSTIELTAAQREALASYTGEHSYDCEVSADEQSLCVVAANRSQARARVERLGFVVRSVNMTG